MKEEDIPVARSEQFSTFRQVIRPESQESVGTLLAALHRILRQRSFTGPVTIHMNQGGVREIVTEQIAKVRPGSAKEATVDKIFDK